MSAGQQELQVQQTAQSERKLTLFDIAKVINELLEVTENATSPEEFKEADDLLKRFVKEDLADKTDAVGWVDRKMDAEAYALQQEIELHKEKIAQINRQQMRLHKMLMPCLEIIGTKSIKGKLSTIRILDGKESLNVVDEDLVPAKYFRQETITVRDNKQIKADLMGGLLVPGAELRTGDPTISIIPKFKQSNPNKLMMNKRIEDSDGEKESAKT